MTSGSPSKGEEAKRIVLEKYPNAFSELRDDYWWTIRAKVSDAYVDLSSGWANELTAWKEAAQRILKERKDSSDV